MAKQGFGGQWVEICRVGKATDSNGVARNLTTDFINQVIANYNSQETGHEAPAVIGHPEENSPAFGWVSELRLNGETLEAKFADVADEFEEAVRSGLYRKRSASFYLDKPNLRHVGFLGGQPPAVKGLRNIQFTEGESFTLENSFNLQEISMEEKDIENLPNSFWEKLKEKMGLGTTKPETVGFSEESLKTMITEAVKASETKLTADFTEQLKTKDEKIASLEALMNSASASGKRAEIVSFVESLPAENGKHWLKRAGVVEFLESLAIADSGDKEKAVCFSEGEVEQKLSRLEWAKQFLGSLPPMIEFGEKFGTMKINPELFNPEVKQETVSELSAVMGIEKKGGDK